MRKQNVSEAACGQLTAQGGSRWRGVSVPWSAGATGEGLLLDISLREQGDPQEQVIGGLLVAAADLPLLRAALDRVLRELDPTPPKAYSVQAVRQDHPAAYARWTPEQEEEEEEEEELLREFDAGRTVDELAELLGRQPGGIRSRLRHRGRLDNSTGPGAASG